MVTSLFPPVNRGSRPPRSCRAPSVRAIPWAMIRAIVARLPAVAVLLLCGAAAWSAPLERTVTELLGTTCTVRLYAGGSDAALDAAFSRIRQIEARMTLNRDDSELARINAEAGRRPVVVSAEVREVIHEGLSYSSLGDGAFDITVEPLVTLWGIGTTKARVPRPEEIRQAVARIGWRDVLIDDAASTVFLKRPGMGIDLGSIAKGYAANEVAKVLKGDGVTSALIDLGGNILTLGTKPDHSPWRIGIQDPSEPRGTKLGLVEIAGGSVTTAGTYERFFDEGGKRYFHILDARTGYPAWNGLAAVAVVAGDSTTADGYDTLLFTLGLERGRRLAESTRGSIEAVFITDSNQVYVTPGLRSRFTLTDPHITLLP